MESSPLFPRHHPAIPDSPPLPPNDPLVMLRLSHATYLMRLLMYADQSHVFGKCDRWMDETGRHCWVCTALTEFDFITGNTQWAAEGDTDLVGWDAWTDYSSAVLPPEPE